MSLLSVMWIVTPIRSFLISWLLAEQRWHILLGNIQKTTCMVLPALWLQSPSSILALTTAVEWIAKSHANSVSRNLHIARKCKKRNLWRLLKVQSWLQRPRHVSPCSSHIVHILHECHGAHSSHDLCYMGTKGLWGFLWGQEECMCTHHTNNHIDFKKNESEKFECDKCEKQFEKKRDLLRHEKSVHYNYDKINHSCH